MGTGCARLQATTPGGRVCHRVPIECGPHAARDAGGESVPSRSFVCMYWARSACCSRSQHVHSAGDKCTAYDVRDDMYEPPLRARWSLVSCAVCSGGPRRALLKLLLKGSRGRRVRVCLCVRVRARSADGTRRASSRSMPRNRKPLCTSTAGVRGKLNPELLPLN